MTIRTPFPSRIRIDCAFFQCLAPTGVRHEGEGFRFLPSVKIVLNQFVGSNERFIVEKSTIRQGTFR